MIPANVKTKIQAASHSAHQVHMADVKANVASSNNIIRHSAARQIDEPGPAQARAIDKILRTPK